MPSPPVSPLKPYSYPSPSPPLDQKFAKIADAINYPNVKYYQNHGFSVQDYSQDRDQEKGMGPEKYPYLIRPFPNPR